MILPETGAKLVVWETEDGMWRVGHYQDDDFKEFDGCIGDFPSTEAALEVVPIDTFYCGYWYVPWDPDNERQVAKLNQRFANCDDRMYSDPHEQ